MNARSAAYGRTYNPALYSALMEIARERLAGSALKLLTSSPESIFEQSKYWCCFCGKGLSDLVSQASGIGPECVKTGDTFLRLIREREAAA